MFKIEFFVDDKNLGEAFKRLAGLAKNVSHAYVPNVESKPNGSVHVASADTQELFVKEMKKRKFTYVNAEGAREIVKAMGFSPSSYSYMLTGLLNKGVLKRTGSPQKYIYSLKAEK